MSPTMFNKAFNSKNQQQRRVHSQRFDCVAKSLIEVSSSSLTTAPNNNFVVGVRPITRSAAVTAVAAAAVIAGEPKSKRYIVVAVATVCMAAITIASLEAKDALFTATRWISCRTLTLASASLTCSIFVRLLCKLPFCVPHKLWAMLPTVSKVQHPRVPVWIVGNCHILLGHQLPGCRGTCKSNVGGFLQIVITMASEIQSFHSHSSIGVIRSIIRPLPRHVGIAALCYIVLVFVPVSRVVAKIVLRKLGNKRKAFAFDRVEVAPRLEGNFGSVFCVR